MKKLLLILLWFFATPAFAGMATMPTVPPGGASGGVAQSQLVCEQNCPIGDAKCLKACKSPTAPAQQPAVPNFLCLNQCTHAGYGYDYCKTACGR